MKANAIGIALSLPLFSCCVPPLAAQPSQVQEELQAIYTRVADGIKNREATPAAEYIAPGFKLRDLHGKDVSLAEVQARLKKSLAQTESIRKMAIDVKRVVTRGDLALVMATRRAVARIKDPKGAPHDYTSTAWALDLWEKGSDGWKLRRVEMLHLQQTLDGKPVRLNIGAGGKPPATKRGAAPDTVRTAARRAKNQHAPPALAPLAVGPERDWFPAAQIYVTPYNYGWGSTVVGMPNYTLGPGGAYNTSAIASNRAMVRQEMRYQNHSNFQAQEDRVTQARAQRAAEQAAARSQKQMQQYLAQQQASGQGTGR